MDLLNAFDMIISSSIVGSLIVLMILITKWILRDKLNPTFHYYIWLVLIIKLIIPFGPENSLNVSNIYQKLYGQNAINENIENVQDNSLEKDKNIDLGASTSISGSESSNGNIITHNIKIYVKKLLFFIWIFGALISIWKFFLANKKLIQILRFSIKNVQIAHEEILYNCMKVMNIKSKVQLLYSSQISSPFLCGLVKQKILIPINVVENINDEELRYIILHELNHLKKKDILINWIIILLSIIYWFNPVVLYGFNKMRKDCEISCDNQVIYYLDDDENIQYGNVLIKVLELCGCSNRLMGTTSMVKNSLEIKRRVIMISKYKKKNIKGILFGIFIICIIGGLGIKINASKINTEAVKAEATTNYTNNIESTNIKKISSDNATSIVPFSSDIVICNSHPDEDYPSGINVTDVGALINDKLVKEGIKSNFIKCTVPKYYNESYQNSRNLITTNVKDYSNTILLDIHRDISENSNSDTRKITFVITKNNPYYEESKKLVEVLSQNINRGNQVKTKILSYNHGQLCFNQDLSKNSVLIELGNNMSSDTDIGACVDTLVSALKSINKNS